MFLRKRSTNGGRVRLRRAQLALTMAAMLTSAMAVGISVDTGNLRGARQRAQIVADAMASAAAQKLPYRDQALAQAETVLKLYQAQYGSALQGQVTFYPEGAAVPTALSVSVTLSTPTLMGGSFSSATPSIGGGAAAGRIIPASILQGVVPLGVQYDEDFDLPADRSASPTQTVLWVSRGLGKQKGNTWALDLPGGSGAADWRAWLNFGYTSRLSVGDVIRSKPGTMAGPIQQALVLDSNSRLNRARTPPYDKDTWQRITPGNPRVAVLPLVDWKSARGGAAELDVKGFAPFWIDDYDATSGRLTGRFVRIVQLRSWPGISIDPNRSSDFDGGLWSVNFSQ